MAALVAGVQYGLSSQEHLNDNKSLIFVKLTDSALRAIEEYVKNKKNCKQHPTIQFLGNEGHLSLPSQSTRGQGFKFSLSSNADIEGPQGSFECIQHTGQKCLESVGSLTCKMRVQANEDVYEVTKNRMAAVEKQHKENCTREIDLDKMGIGRRVKVRTKMVNGGGLPSKRTPAPVPHTPPVNTHTKPQGNNYAQKPGNPEIMKKSIRERVIHLLALRPYKKPELYLAVNRDGLREKDRSNLTNTLMSVATVKGNTYHLMRHLWNDVQEDWPFYTEEEKQILKRRKPQNLTPPGSSDGSSESPRSVNPGGSPPLNEGNGGAKRPGYYDGADGLPTKRQRISHYKKPLPQQPVSGGGVGGGGGGHHVIGHNHHNNTNHHQPPLSNKMNSQENTAPPPPSLPHPSPPTPPQEKSPTKQPITEYPKYLLDYTTIKDKEERRRYKEDFNANYNEYRQLHSLVEKVSRRFTTLDERLKREEKGSDNWQKIKNQILKEYQENKKDRRHQDAKRRFQYLHEKLSHIKRLVIEYDSKET